MPTKEEIAERDKLTQQCADLESRLSGLHESHAKVMATANEQSHRANRAEAERDAIAAEMVEAAANILDTHGDSAVAEALEQRLCCNGQMCGCRGASIGEYLQHLIRALKPGIADT